MDGNGNGYELKWMREHPAVAVNMRREKIIGIMLVIAVLWWACACISVRNSGSGTVNVHKHVSTDASIPASVIP
jgi:hypothetical protein